VHLLFAGGRHYKTMVGPGNAKGRLGPRMHIAI